MCVCSVYVCVYMCVLRAHLWLPVSVCTSWRSLHAHECVLVCAPVFCMGLCVHICVCLYVYLYMCACACLHACTYVHLCVRVHVYESICVYTPFLPLQRGWELEKASELQAQPLTCQRTPQGPTPLQQLPSSWVFSRHGQGVALPTHPHCGLPPSQPRAPHVALHPSPQTRRPSLRLAVCILPIEAPWVSHSHRPFYVLATARTFSNCPSSKEEATSQGPTQATFLQRLALYHTPLGSPHPTLSLCPICGRSHRARGLVSQAPSLERVPVSASWDPPSSLSLRWVHRSQPRAACSIQSAFISLLLTPFFTFILQCGAVML